MSLDLEPTDGPAAAPGWTSPPVAPAVELICLLCDVTWTAVAGDCCWMCGGLGRRAAEALPWSATAPALFL